jgi:hypothetical protein
MRSFKYFIVWLALVSCSPETDLQHDQAQAGASVANSGQSAGVSSSAQAGQLVDPPTGAVGIPTNLASLVVSFAEVVTATAGSLPFALRPDSGGSVSAQLGAAVSCAGTCYAIEPSGQLAPSTSYAVEILAGSLQFLDGKPIPAANLGSFTTDSSADLFAPRIQAFTVSAAEGCVSVHLAADEVVRAEVELGAGDAQASVTSDSLASTLDFAKRLPDLPPAVQAQAVTRIVDRAGNSTVSAPVVLDLPPQLPRIVITEVLANPAGSEITQEFVEIYNAGSESVALGGLRLADKSGSDVLPDSALPAGAYALLVPENYNAADGKDTAPRDGTLVLPLSGRLAGDGLSNTGEPVQLLSADGYVISQYGGWVDVSATGWSGMSVKRSSFDACDGPNAWSQTPTPATPGW